MANYSDPYSYYNIPCPRNAGNQASNRQPQQGGTGAPMFPSPSIGTTLPTGVPLGPAVTGTTPSPVPPSDQTPQTLQSAQFTPGFLRTQIGRRVRVEFLIGTSSTTDRFGTLVGVGASYILIRPEGTDDLMLCDIYSIKFVTFYY